MQSFSAEQLWSFLEEEKGKLLFVGRSLFTGNLAIVQNHGQTVTALVGRALKAAGDIARSVQMLRIRQSASAAASSLFLI